MKDKALPSTVEQKIQSCAWGMIRKAAVSGLGFPIHAAYTWLGRWPLFQVICCAGSLARWFFSMSHLQYKLFSEYSVQAHCDFRKYRGNSWHMAGTRKLKAPQKLKMGLCPCWRHMNCESENQTYHLPYLSLREKTTAVLVFSLAFSLGQCTSHAVLSLYCKSMEWSL